MSVKRDQIRRKRSRMTKAQLLDALEHLESRLSQQGKVLEALGESEQRLRDFSESSSDWFWEMGPDLRFSYISLPHGKISGLAPEQVIGLRREEIAGVNAGDEKWKRHLADLNVRLPFRDFRYSLTDKAGETHHFSTSGIPIFDASGHFLGYRGTGRDITAELQAGRAAKRANEQLGEAIEMFPDAFILYDKKDRLVICNQKYRDVYDVPAEIYTPGNTFEEMIRAGIALGKIPEATAQEEEWIKNRVYLHQHPTGEAFEQILDNGTVLLIVEQRTKEGGIVGIRRDITQMKKAEEALQESQDRYREAARVARLGHWVWDEIEDRCTYCSEEHARIYGLSVDEYLAKNTSTEEDIGWAHPDDRERFAKVNQEALEKRTGFEIEYRIIRADGEVRHVHEIATVTLDDDGEVIQTAGVLQDITDRIAAEESLRKTEERYSLFISGVRDIVWEWDVTTNTLGTTSRALDFLGYEKGELELTTHEWESRIHPDDYEPKKQAMLQYLRGETDIYSFEYRVRTKSGHYMWLLERGVGLRDETGRVYLMAGSGSDISGRKEAEEALRYSEERFHDFAESASDWYWEMDKELRFTSISDHLQETVGGKPENPIGKTRREWVGSIDDEEIWQAHEEDMNNRRPFRDFIYNYTNTDGGLRYIKISGIPVFTKDGEFNGYRGTGLDVTQSLQNEAKVLQSNKLATLGQMASGIAHEIAQPLNVIMMSSEISLMEIDEGNWDIAKLQEKFSRIENQAERMAEIINHMRTFARQDHTTKRHFNPVMSTSNAVKLVQSQISGMDIQIDCQFPDACKSVFGSSLQLEQVIINLLTNAIDAVQAEAAKNRLLEPKIELTIVDDDDCIRIIVSDNGGGTPPHVMKQLFDPYFTTKEEGKGTGLGLTISHSIVSEMDGQLFAQNIENGTAFTITLPAFDDTDHTSKNNKDSSSAPKSAALSGGIKILVVDDERQAANTIAEYLNIMGHTVSTANDGYEALEFIAGNHVDAIITDLRMPKMDGYELLQRIRNINTQVPVIVTTGHTSFGQEEEITAEGATAVIRKPVNLAKISEIIEELAAGPVT